MKKRIVLISISFVVLIGVIIGSVWTYRYYTAETRGKISEREKIQSAEFRIFSYEYFYNMIADIQSQEALYDIQYDLLQVLTPDDENYMKQQQTVAAIQAHVIRLKNQYNADVLKEGTRGQFKDSDLPDYIEPVCEYGRRTL